MAVSEAQFRAALPEFTNTPATIVNNALAFATTKVSAPALGDLADEAIIYYTGHVIHTDPRGERTPSRNTSIASVSASISRGGRVLRGTDKYARIYNEIIIARVVPMLLS